MVTLASLSLLRQITPVCLIVRDVLIRGHALSEVPYVKSNAVHGESVTYSIKLKRP